MSSSELSDHDTADTGIHDSSDWDDRDAGREDDLVSVSDEERSTASRKLYHRTWPSSDDNASVEDKGWEDWDEDQRRALGKSHERTMDTLEEASTRMSIYSRSSMLGAMSKPTAKDPKGQILPSGKELSLQEIEAKKRFSHVDHPSKHNKAFFTKNCFLLTAVGVLCFCAFMALTLLVPPGSISESVMTREGTLRDNSATGNKFGDISLGQDSIIHAFPPDVNRNAEVVDMETTNSLYSFLRKAAFSIGNFIIPSDNDETTVAVNTLTEMKMLNEVKLPNYEDFYSLVDEPIFGAQAVLWITKRSGADSLKDILTFCLKLVLASELAENHQEAQSLEIYSTNDNTGRFVNVNTETLNGLKRAQEIGVVDSELVQVILTPYIVEASSLFEHKARRGRIFVLLRHPVDQAHSDFLFRKTLPEGDPEKIPNDLVIAQFVESDWLVSNQLTRTLLNVTNVIPLTAAHILGAKKILQERILVGLLESFDTSVNRFADYFGWNVQDSVCVANFKAARDNRDAHEQLSNSTLEWKILADRNYADKQLYEFAQSLFERQKTLTISNK